MNEEERLELEQELLLTCSKSQAINKYLDILDNWNKLKDYLLSKHNYKTMNSYVYDEIWLKIKELEKGESDE